MLNSIQQAVMEKSPFFDLRHDVEATRKVVEGDRPLQPENMTDNL
jgi:hypothetical protein